MCTKPISEWSTVELIAHRSTAEVSDAELIKLADMARLKLSEDPKEKARCFAVRKRERLAVRYRKHL